MTTQAAGTSVRASVVVEAPIDRAFSVFTDGMGTWWPSTVLEHSKLDAHGEGWERHRDMVGNQDGWQLGLDAFARAAAAAT